MIPAELLQSIKDNDPALIKVDLQEALASCENKLEQIEELAGAFKTNTHIRRIDLSNNYLGFTEFPNLFSALKSHPNIETIVLKGNTQLDTILTDIFELIANCKTVIAVDAGQSQLWDKTIVKNRLASLIAEIWNPIPNEDEDNIENTEARTIREAVHQNLLDTNFDVLLKQAEEQDDPRVVALVQAYHQWQQIEQVLAANTALKLSKRYRALVEKIKQPPPNFTGLIAEAEQLKEDGHLLANHLIQDIRIAWLINTNQEAEVEALFTELSNDNEALYKLADYVMKNTSIEYYSPGTKVIGYSDFLDIAKTVFEGKENELAILKRHDEFLPIIFFTLLEDKNIQKKLNAKFGTADVVVYELLLLTPEILQEDKSKLPITSLKAAEQTYMRAQRSKNLASPPSAQDSNILYTKFEPQAFKDTLKDNLKALAKIKPETPVLPINEVKPVKLPVKHKSEDIQPLTKPTFKLRNILAASLLILGLALALAFCGFGIAGLAGSAIALQALALTFGWMSMGTLTAAIVATAVGGAAGLGLTLTGIFTYFKHTRPVKTVTQGIEAGISGTMSRLSSIFPKCRPCSFGQEDSVSSSGNYNDPLNNKLPTITSPSTPNAALAAPST